MAWVILLKGANTGGNLFRPSLLAQELPRLGLVSIGAAGTFVARTEARSSDVETALRSKLPIAVPMMVVPGSDVLRILRSDPVGAGPFAPGVRKFVSVATERLPATVRLPIDVPGSENWEVRVLATDGPFAMGVRRRLGPKLIYPNDVVEREFGVESTTRWWETLESVGSVLGSPTTGSGGPARKRAARSVPPSRPRKALRARGDLSVNGSKPIENRGQKRDRGRTSTSGAVQEAPRLALGITPRVRKGSPSNHSKGH